ncbi:MAG: NmrA family NAD(P)-binding protein [Bacteroidales bacterium]|nr:NmrA family NAD(P)-binding protein [Bacteroidales bacterium]
MKILITGATGNVGIDTIDSLFSIKNNHEIIAGVRNIEKSKKILSKYNELSYRNFDFENKNTFEKALENIDIIFVLRPPNIANVNKYFLTLFDMMQKKQVSKIIFLSIQGVENQKNIPHYKIEKAILNYKFDYVFLRPSYFMQNLTTTLLKEIKEEKKIFIPSGKLKFNWVDTKDIELVGAKIIQDFENYKNNAYEITGSEFEDFNYVADLLTRTLGFKIKYESPNLLKFFIQKKKYGIKPMMIFVMIMLHYLPRFGKNENNFSDTVRKITDKEPTKLLEYIKREQEKIIDKV